MSIVDEAVKRILEMVDIKEELYYYREHPDQGIVFTEGTEKIIHGMRPHPEAVLREGEGSFRLLYTNEESWEDSDILAKYRLLFLAHCIVVKSKRLLYGLQRY